MMLDFLYFDITEEKALDKALEEFWKLVDEKEFTMDPIFKVFEVNGERDPDFDLEQ